MLKIVSVYRPARDLTFAGIYVGAEISLGDYPIEALSNVDYFHPSLDAHHFITAVMENRLTGIEGRGDNYLLRGRGI